MKKDTPALDKVIEIDEARIRDHLGELVRRSVGDTLNALLQYRSRPDVQHRATSAHRRGGIPLLPMRDNLPSNRPH